MPEQTGTPGPHCSDCDGDGECVCDCPACCGGYGHIQFLGQSCFCGEVPDDPRHVGEVVSYGEPWTGEIQTRCSCGWKSMMLRRGYGAGFDVIEDCEAHIERCRKRAGRPALTAPYRPDGDSDA